MTTDLLILLQLLVGHLLTDFVFQSKKMVAHKRKYKVASFYLYIHVMLAGVLSYLFVMQWERIEIILFIGLTHYIIDLWKLYQGKDTLILFLTDQLLHILVLLGVWLYLIQGFGQIGSVITSLLSNPDSILLLCGYLIVIYPIGFVVGKATESWNKEISRQFKDDSLKNAGRYIGIFERLLVLTFILTNNFAAIGFLIGAKSILRFSDTKGTRKQTEYVLIGTLMSFFLCILTGLIIVALSNTY